MKDAHVDIRAANLMEGDVITNHGRSYKTVLKIDPQHRGVIGAWHLGGRIDYFPDDLVRVKLPRPN